MPIAPNELPAVVAANNKLLKALIGLLAIRDPQLLGELRTVFAMADKSHDATSPAEARTWARVRHELDVITDMVEGDDDDPVAASGKSH